MINAVIVEHIDSVREIIINSLKADPDINVLAEFNNSKEAIAYIGKTKPDILLIDYELTQPGGLEATRLIMESTPLPIVIISSQETVNSFNTLEAGAVAVVERPPSRITKSSGQIMEKLVRTVKLMAEIKVVKRIPNKKASSFRKNNSIVSKFEVSKNLEVIVIGASTGGPIVIDQILKSLPGNFPIPIVVVQHIAAGFTNGMVKWLNGNSNLIVEIANNKSQMKPGHCYIAPEEVHIKFANNKTIVHSSDAPVNNLRPAISCLFNSAANIFGNKALGIILTGMGKDGAEELKSMRKKGSITIAQDKNSSLIFGMPGEAIRINAANYIFSPNQIIEFLKRIGNN